MATKNQRYEAVVKLVSGAAVQYHNINSGLKKFHRFVKEKYKNQWIFWTVRRKSTKEVLATFNNEIIIQIRAVKIFLPKQRNVLNSGFFVRVPFSRDSVIINRNLFFSDKIIFRTTEDFIIINELIFFKAIANATNELMDYFKGKGQIIALGEIKLGEIKMEKILMSQNQKNGTEPTEDYP